MMKGLTAKAIWTTVLAVLIVAVLAAPATAAPQSDTGGPNGPCGPNSNVNILLKYKARAQVTYKITGGAIIQKRLPYHATSYSYVVFTGKDALNWWRVDIVAGNGYVSRQGSYGYCSS